VSFLVFGDKSIDLRYAVIVCSKCRLHAQIIEIGKNTLRCQRCGTVLEARRLRILYSSEQLDDAVTFRTRLQAEISGTGSETFSTRERASDNLLPKKHRKLILLDLLEAAGGEIQIEEFRQKALENGINPEKFGLFLKNLLEIGELYSPEPGKIKRV
jgi:hypothetical protein